MVADERRWRMPDFVDESMDSRRVSRCLIARGSDTDQRASSVQSVDCTSPRSIQYTKRHALMYEYSTKREERKEEGGRARWR
jgi:hypothetical protein